MTSANVAINAASVLFAQSIADDCARSYLKVFAMLKPADWEPQTDTTKIDLHAIHPAPISGTSKTYNAANRACSRHGACDRE